MIVVAGHVCLDVIPHLERDFAGREGSLHEVGPATFSVGGAVGNVGRALAQLGVPARLVGRVGEDPFGTIVQDLLAERGGRLVAVSDAATSYSIVISPPGADRSFLHHSGCNDGFGGRELAAALERLPAEGVDFLHFGYPPIMRRVFEDGGAALADVFASIRAAGTRVSLDMATPDPHGAAGAADWRAFLRRVLPHVDIFAPSFDDMAAMLDDVPAAPSENAVRSVADRCLGWGARLALLKLGEDGLYLRTSVPARLGEAWHDRELWSPNFRVDVKGTTGAGDATIAGFLAGLDAEVGPETALDWASAVGACSVEGLDAHSRIPRLGEVRERIEEGWPRVPRASKRGREAKAGLDE